MKTNSWMEDLYLAPATKKVLAHLRSRGSISRLEALFTGSLTKRISELRAVGYDITGETRKDEAGRRYVRYSLAA